jgi:UDP-N-acetylglucosamine 2-epimerase (non-hydrolysing)
MKPFGFHDYNRLQQLCFCAVSDSGTIAEESTLLGFPAVTPRDAIERPESMDAGGIVVTGLDERTILESVDLVTSLFEQRRALGTAFTLPEGYEIANTAERVVSLIVGTARLSNQWDGIRLNDGA